ncbi:hypothetical protein [Amycolatopsis sp. EV170708-02-1]|uniref:hypothetical protein n=1 Tax=Amycolatopsis sp. EV170708-02-1 TaxID=2919322 RepID=UPI001F0B91CD|nr:hypothetical protein [Amycolatopsis sp. EV170708-02-1]UMP04666.1 hypothetical protein MJQ72_07445 [Amycolatopsis sp. EV170708-02-1]
MAEQTGPVGKLFRAGFRTLAALRRARAFHPDGLLLKGELHASRRDDIALPPEPVTVTVRMSKGAGLPGRLPDALGLAIRIPDADGYPWDFTLTTSAGRVLPSPARAWTSGRYSSLLPYRTNGELVWLSARAETPRHAEASLDALRRLVKEGPVTYLVETVRANGHRKPCATLTLREVDEDAPRPAFDPMLNAPPGWEPRPRWLTALRERAYEGSREGR